MGQLETLQEISDRLSFIKDQGCLDRTYCTVSSAALTLESGELNTEAIPELTIIGDITTAITDFKTIAEATMLVQYELYMTWLTNYLAVYKPPDQTPRQFFTRKYAGAYQSSFIRRVFSASRFKLSEVEAAHSQNLIERYNSLTISIESKSFELISIVGISQSGLIDIPINAKSVVIEIDPAIPALYSNRISVTYQNRYLFGGISFIYVQTLPSQELIDISSQEIDIQWKKQIIDIPLDARKIGVYIQVGLEAVCTFYA